MTKYFCDKCERPVKSPSDLVRLSLDLDASITGVSHIGREARQWDICRAVCLPALRTHLTPAPLEVQS